MNRRGFLGTMLACLGATAIDPKALLWSPTPEASAIVVPDAILTLNQITMQMLREIVNLTGSHGLPMLVEPSKIGYGVSGHVLNHQYSVGMEIAPEIDRFGLDAARFIKPAATAMAQRIGRPKASGSLPLPNGVVRACVVRDPVSGLSLRGLQQYVEDWQSDDGGYHKLRFDMLVAN